MIRIKKKWRNILIGYFLFYLVIVVSVIIIANIPDYKEDILRIVSPLGELKYPYFTLASGFLGGAPLVFLFYKYKLEAISNDVILTEIRNVRSEVESNKRKLKTLINYFEVNGMYEVYFYPDEKKEFWMFTDKEDRTVDCTNGKGVLWCIDLSSEYINSNIVTSIKEIEKMYGLFELFYTSNAVNRSGIESILEMIEKVNENIKKIYKKHL